MSVVDSMTTKEDKMLMSFVPNYALIKTHIGPVDLYRMAVDRAFRFNIQNEYTESLRRTMNAISNVSFYRGTTEFEELIREGE